MGAIVFILTGITRVRRSTITRRHIRLGLAAGCAILAVTAALFLNGAELQSGGSDAARIEEAVNDWLGDSGYLEYDLDIDGDSVRVVAVGPDTDMPDTSELADDLRVRLGRTITVEAVFLVGEVGTATGS